MQGDLLTGLGVIILNREGRLSFIAAFPVLFFLF